MNLNVTTGLGRTCTSCGKERKSKMLLYDPQNLSAYCSNPWVCNEEHPNSPKNLIKNQKETELIKYEDAQQVYAKFLENAFDSEMAKKIHRLVNYPTTVRIQSPEMAQFLVAFQEENNLSSMSDVIKHCVQMMMDNKLGYNQEYKEMKVEKQKQDTKEKAIEEIEQEPASMKVSGDSDDLVF